MVRPTGRDPNIGTGGSGIPIFEQPTPEVLIPQPTPTPWVFPTIPSIPPWLNPFPPATGQTTGAGQVSETPSPTGGTYTSDQVDECKNCSNMDLALGRCNCALKGEPIIVDPDDPEIQIPNAPAPGINCQAGFTKVLDNTTGVWRCMPQAIIDEKLGDESCTTCDSAICKECDAWDVECERLRKANGTCPPASPQNPECDLGCWLTGGGCECEKKPCTGECPACKYGTGECSDKCSKCDAWDIPCEIGCLTGPGNGEECGMFDFGCKVGKWWEEYGTIVMIVGGVIVLGILLWLLRPLFGVAKNITSDKTTLHGPYRWRRDFG